MKHEDFVTQYAASIDRMMATTASRLDLAEDFMPAWGLLTRWGAPAFENVRVGAIHQENEPGQKRKKNVVYGVDIQGNISLITREQYELAAKHGAQVVVALPPPPP
jgi:hypothetical protein